MFQLKSIIPTLIAVSCWFSAYKTVAQEIPQLEFETTKIWDAAPHNAFTDIVRHQGKIYCTFREATSHVPANHQQDGKVRLIVSDDGNSWSSLKLFEMSDIDLRDPKLSVTPDDRLMILMGGSHYDSGKLLKRTPLVSFYDAEVNKFDPLTKINIDTTISNDEDWLWRVTWHDGIGYGVVYQASKTSWSSHLLNTVNGIDYQHVTTFELPGKPNESTIRFDENSDMFVVVRNEDGQSRGHFGRSKPPYKQWNWHEINQRLGGPNLIQLPDQKWLLGTRKYGQQATTIIGLLQNDGSFAELHEFPSGGDTSYPGLLINNNQLWVSYYSSHQKKTSIYLSRIGLNELMKATNIVDRRLVLDRFKPFVYESETPLPYRLLSPETSEPERKYPLVLFLHGAGERGNDNRAQLVHGMSDFARDENRSRYPAYVVAPQCPKDKRWVEVDWTVETMQMPDEPSETMTNVMGLIDQLIDKYPIDKNRIYITGLSMGGFGTWDLIARRPKMFAAALPVCGGVDPKIAGNISHLPLWVVHGDSDTTVNPKHSIRMVEALKKAGGEPRFTLMKNTSHDSWTATYANPEVLEWLFEQRLVNE